MRKFHTIVRYALKMYEEKPFTSKNTISKQVKNLIFLYVDVKATPNGSKKPNDERQFFMDSWTGTQMYTDGYNNPPNTFTITDNSSNGTGNIYLGDSGTLSSTTLVSTTESDEHPF